MLNKVKKSVWLRKNIALLFAYAILAGLMLFILSGLEALFNLVVELISSATCFLFMSRKWK